MSGASPLSDPEFLAGLRPVPSGLEGQEVPWPAVDVEGVGPEGAPIRVALDAAAGNVLFAFLATRCDGCEAFWSGLGPSGPIGALGSVRVVVVTKGPTSVDPAEVGRVGASLGSVPVVMSDAPWLDYRVTGYPFFVLVDPATRKVIGETVAFGMDDVLALLGTAGSTGSDGAGSEGAGDPEPET